MTNQLSKCQQSVLDPVWACPISSLFLHSHESSHPHWFTISHIIGNLAFFTTIFGFVVVIIKLYLFSFDKFKAALNLHQPLSLVRHGQENHILKQHTTVAATTRPPIGKLVLLVFGLLVSHDSFMCCATLPLLLFVCVETLDLCI